MFPLALVRRFSAAWIVAVTALGCGVDETASAGTPICDASQLAAALASAQPGMVIQVGECHVAGPFTVPAGVTLAGQGAAVSWVDAAQGTVGLTVSPGALATEVQNLSVASDGIAGIVAKGAGAVALQGVDVIATRGIGIGSEDNTSLTIADVALLGPVTPQNVNDFPAEVSPADTATHGLVVATAESALLANVTATGFADHGALFVESEVAWQGGAASGNLGTGLMIEGGSAALVGLQLCGTMVGNRTLPAYGAVVASSVEGVDAPEVLALGLTVCDNEGPGVLVYRAGSFQLSGTAADPVGIDGNAGVGVLVIESKDVVIKHAEISGTKEVSLPIGENEAPILVGDGLQLVGSIDGIAATDVSFTGNERVGLMIDLLTVHVSLFHPQWSLEVTATANGFGALCQGTPPGEPPESWLPDDEDDWDLGIARDRATLTKDFVDPMSTLPVGFGDPCFVPAPTDIVQNGLAGVGVP